MITTTDNYISVRHEQGFEVFVLQNEHLEIALVPELGAKVISLINRRTGREWMWHSNGRRKLFRNQSGDDFANSTMIGWDECLPTIAPCWHRGRQLPDHGEVWSVPWKIDGELMAQGKLKTSVRLAVTPLDFERTIELCGNVIHLRYRLTNRSHEPEEFLWAMHPLLPIHTGDALELTSETRLFLNDKTWIDSLKFSKTQPAQEKVFAGPLSKGHAAIANAATGDRLTFAWDTHANPMLGLWLTRGGWNGHDHLALEPCNGASDSLSAACLERHWRPVPALGSLSWEVCIRIDPANE